MCNAEGFGEGGHVVGKFIPGFRIILPQLALPVRPVVNAGEGLPAAEVAQPLILDLRKLRARQQGVEPL